MVDASALGVGWAEMPPGPELGAALAGVELGSVPNDHVVDVPRAQARQLAHEQARMLAALVEVSHTTPGVAGPARGEQTYEWACGEVGAALWAGRIDRARAWVFADHLDPAVCGLDAAGIEAICAHLVPLAGGLTTGQLAGRLLRAIVAVDPEHARRRYRSALREREVVSYLDRDGTAAVSAHRLDPGEAAAAVERLQALARAAKRAGHPGRLCQIQADLFCGLLNGHYHGQTQAEIIADLLAHLDDEAEVEHEPADDRGSDPRDQPDRPEPGDAEPVAAPCRGRCRGIPAVGRGDPAASDRRTGRAPRRRCRGDPPVGRAARPARRRPVRGRGVGERGGRHRRPVPRPRSAARDPGT